MGSAIVLLIALGVAVYVIVKDWPQDGLVAIPIGIVAFLVVTFALSPTLEDN